MKKPAPAREISLAHRRGHLKQSMMKLLRAGIEAGLPRALPVQKSRTFRVIELSGRFK
jgi:hypothetical protein